LYLQELEKDGLVEEARRGRDGGRGITPLGVEEIRDAQVVERVGFTAAKVDSLACRVTFDLTSHKGLIVLNVSVVDQECLERAVYEMIPVFKAGLGMGNYAAIARAGETLGNYTIPPGKVGIGTVCSVTLNGVLLNARIPALSRFGGVLETSQGKPARFTDVIYYEWSSLDPLEIFIKGGLTSVRKAVTAGLGRIGASFREVPSAVISETQNLHHRLEQIGLGGILLMGKPNQPLLDFPVQEGRTGIIVTGGLNPIAAVEESGISTHNIALCTLYPFERLVHYSRLLDRYLLKDPRTSIKE